MWSGCKCGEVDTRAPERDLGASSGQVEGLVGVEPMQVEVGARYHQVCSGSDDKALG